MTGGQSHLPPRHPAAPAAAQGGADGSADRRAGGAAPAQMLSRLSMSSSAMGDEEVDPEYVCAICLARPSRFSCLP